VDDDKDIERMLVVKHRGHGKYDVLGTCLKLSRIGGKCFIRPLRSYNGSYTTLRYRYVIIGVKPNTHEAYTEVAVIAKGYRDAELLPYFRRSQ